MNSFKAYIMKNDAWGKLPNTVFPFSFGELLDERLDEAYLTFYDYREKDITPTTRIKIVFTNKEKDYEKFYIVASDTSIELPVGSGKYKHQLYLIELTKLLEGILCQSLTFTNSIGRRYESQKNIAQTVSYGGNALLPSNFVSPIKLAYARIQTTFPSAKNIGDSFIKQWSEENGYMTGVNPIIESHSFPTGTTPPSITVYTKCVITNGDGNIYEALMDETITIIPTGEFSIRYTVVTCVIPEGTAMETFHYFDFGYENIGTFKSQLPLARWTITDCVNRCLELAEPLRYGENPRFTFDGVTYLNGEAGSYSSDGTFRPGVYKEGSLAEKYDKIFAPEFTMTQCTLREQLKVIGGYIHAEPWLDENDVIHYQPFGLLKRAKIDGLAYVYDSAARHINEYCTDIRGNVQNLVSSLGYAQGVIMDPGKGLYRSLRTETAYTRITESNGIAATEFPVYEIQKVLCGIADGSSWYVEPVDVTPFVFEETEYGANLSGFSGGYPYSRAYAIYYTIGQKGLRGLFYRAPNNVNAAVYSKFSISNILASVTGKSVDEIDGKLVEQGAANLIFNITYKPISNHYVSHGKQLYVSGETPFAQIYNQGENLVESQFYGENMKGVAARLGNTERERTYILGKWENIPETGEIIDNYVISAVSVECMPRNFKVTVGLTKDFNRISQYVGINSQKRMYEVSERQAYNRSILLKENLVIGKKPEGYSNEGCLFKDITPFKDMLDPTSNASKKISLAFFRGYSKKVASAKTKEEVVNAALSYYLAFPVIPRALGNTINFAFSFKDNYSAGDSAPFINSKEGDIDITGRWQSDVRYTDYYGRAYYADFALGAKYAPDTSQSSGTQQLVELAFSSPQYNDTSFPETPIRTSLPFAVGDETTVDISPYRLRKDNREIPQFNIELEVKSGDPDLIIGSAFAEYCPLVTDVRIAFQGFIEAPTYCELVLLANADSVGKFDLTYEKHDGDAVYKFFNGKTMIQEKEDGSLYFVPTDASQFFAISGVQYYGWVLRTPVIEEKVDVEDEDGNAVKQTYNTGGRILLYSKKPFTAEDKLFENMHIYVTK